MEVSSDKSDLLWLCELQQIGRVSRQHDLDGLVPQSSVGQVSQQRDDLLQEVGMEAALGLFDGEQIPEALGPIRMVNGSKSISTCLRHRKYSMDSRSIMSAPWREEVRFYPILLTAGQKKVRMGRPEELSGGPVGCVRSLSCAPTR